MLKLLKNLEYLIPLFGGMPNWVKGLFLFWVALSVVLLIIVASIVYTKNKEKALKEESHA